MIQIQKPRQGYKLIKSIFGKYEEIPEEWELINFNDLVFFQEGPGLRHWQFREHGMKVINVTNLVNDFLDVNNTNRYIDLEEFKQNYRHFAIDENDLVLASSGNSYGKVSVVRKQDLPLMMNTSVIRLRTKSKNLNNKYMEFFLKSIFFKKQIDLLITGAAQPNFGPSHLKQIRLKLPPINEQQKIASILSNVDSLIQQTQKIVEQTQRLKKGLMQKLLTRGIGHTKFKKVKWHFNQEISIPENWDVVTLSEVCEKRKSNNVKSELYVGIENIESGQGCLLFRSNVNNFLIKVPFHKNDVLYSKLRPYLEKVWYADSDGFCSSDIYPLVANEKINGKFLFYILLSKQFLKFANATTAGGNIPKTRWNDIRMFKLFLPNMQEQEKIVSFIEHVDLQIIRIQPKKSDLMKLKKGLMQKLLTGQIRVKV